MNKTIFKKTLAVILLSMLVICFCVPSFTQASQVQNENSACTQHNPEIDEPSETKTPELTQQQSIYNSSDTAEQPFITESPNMTDQQSETPLPSETAELVDDEQPQATAVPSSSPKEIVSPTNSISKSVKGTRDISNEAVYLLTLTPDKINSGGVSILRLEFNDTKIKIQSGDYITVTWPRTGEATIGSYSNTIKLYIKGIYVADVVITPRNATITFFDTINNISEIEGWVEFEIWGINSKDTTLASDVIATVTAGTLTADLTIHKDAPQDPEPGGDTPGFYIKLGGLNAEKERDITWHLFFNDGYYEVREPVIVEDYIQPGHSYIENSMTIAITGPSESAHNYGDKIQQFLDDFPGTSIDIDAEKSTIKIILSPEAITNKKLSITYHTYITRPTQEIFYNNTLAWYDAIGYKKVEGIEVNHSARNAYAGAGIIGVLKGELKIYKSTQLYGLPIQGVVFELTREDGEIIADGKTTITLTTDENGIASIKDLKSGVYLVKEISAPEWIEFDPLTAQTYKFTISDTDTEGVLLEIKNEIVSTDITVIKKWEDNDDFNGLRPEKIIVQLIANNVIVDTVELNDINGWSYTFEDIPAYDNGEKITYTVNEIDVDRYNKTISGNESEGFTITNTLDYHGFELPATGGIGILPQILAGTLLLICCMTIIIYVPSNAKRQDKKH